ncbi:MAG: hypothetical protein E7018_03535 [Alphaproteobacteria bacterium]|nr:hypothetical protein [Alphaproteobacteria bacterium]
MSNYEEADKLITNEYGTLEVKRKILPGEDIRSIAKRLSSIAKQENNLVETSFNGIPLFVAPGMTIDKALKTYKAFRNAISERFMKDAPYTYIRQELAIEINCKFKEICKETNTSDIKKQLIDYLAELNPLPNKPETQQLVRNELIDIINHRSSSNSELEKNLRKEVSLAWADANKITENLTQSHANNIRAAYIKTHPRNKKNKKTNEYPIFVKNKLKVKKQKF